MFSVIARWDEDVKAGVFKGEKGGREVLGSGRQVLKCSRITTMVQDNGSATYCCKRAKNVCRDITRATLRSHVIKL